MSEKQETIDDHVAATKNFSRMIPPPYGKRIEAAAMRMGVGVSKTETTTHGNAAAMRDALEKIRSNLTMTYQSEEEERNLNEKEVAELKKLIPQPDPDWKAICEKCHDGEIEPKCEYYGEPNGCNSPIVGEHPYMPRGNGLKMRATLVQVELFLSLVERHGHPTLNPGDKCVACQGVEELRALVCKTLAAPARNCDVYDNPYDAADAWPDHEMCAGRRHQKGSCDGCTYQPARCVAKWMYKKAEEKRGDESPRTRQESEVRE